VISPAEQKPRLDKYELLEEIGHGGMAVVYRGRDKRLERDVAIKIIHRHLRENKEVATRFASEARAVAKVKHENIVEVYDVSDETEEERYLVVELIGGTTLRALIAENGHMPAEVAAALGIEIAAGLQHAHEQGVVHRDVKPENVLVEPPREARDSRTSQERPSESRAARIKITDFGIAKLLDAQGVTSTGQVLGSPAHMAPEQIEGGDVTARADVFGLGVLLYECMVGKLPFEGKNPAQVLRRVLDGQFTPAERARPTVGKRFSQVLQKALARDAAERWASVAELSDALRDELRRLGFDDPKRELAEYLIGPTAYLADYESRVVARLVERGRRARKERAPALAAADFNRALAFRPSNAELLSEVAGLARREKFVRGIKRAAILSGVSVVLGGSAYGITQLVKSRARPIEPEQPAKLPTRPTVPRPRPSALPPRASISEERVPARPSAVPARPKSAPQFSRPPAGPQAMRPVRITMSGAKGDVRIDGRPVDWFMKTHELEVGRTYTFEFIRQNESCCLQPKPMVVTIPAGAGEYQIHGNIPFRDAIIHLSGPEGTEASCSDFGGVRVKAGATTSVRMNGAERKGTCLVIPPEGSGEPRPVDVVLQPGEPYQLR
jgi:tRNA A-37 threonylcarbamoyl transferase component Bud32